MEKKNIEIPFGAFDSELGGFEYTIPEGYKAEIKDGKVVVRKTESEDEKIRKAIKYGLDHVFTNNTTVYETTKEQCLAWLEKQANHANFCNKIKIGDKVTRNEDGVLVNLSQLNRVAKPADKVEPKFHEGDIIKPKDGGHEPWQIMQVDMFDKKYRFKDGYVIHFSQEDNYELVEQKSTWSEEDKNMLKWVIGYLDNKMLNTSIAEERTACKNAIDWLEKQGNLIVELQKTYAEIGRLVKENCYLKEKQCEQKPVEWSGVDNAIVEGICLALEYSNESGEAIEKYENWLHSIKDRVLPP